MGIQLDCKEERITIQNYYQRHLLTLAKLLYPPHLVINFPRYVGFIIAILISLAYFPKLGYEIFIMQCTYSSRISAYFVLRFNTFIRFLEFYIFIVLLVFHFLNCVSTSIIKTQTNALFLPYHYIFSVYNTTLFRFARCISFCGTTKKKRYRSPLCQKTLGIINDLEET